MARRPSHDTPAKRARRRRDPAIYSPPPRIKGDRGASLRSLRLVISGRSWPIADNVEGDTPWAMGMDQTGQVTLPVRDPSGALVDALRDEQMLQQDGARCTVSGVVYVIAGVDHDGTGLYTLTLEDEVSWRLKQFNSFKAASRATVTRFGFIQSLADEASRRPLTRLRTFIPEVDDKQPIAPVKKGS